MTPTEKTLYWRKYAVQNTKLERIAYYIMIKAFRDCLEDVIASIEQNGAEQTIYALDGVFSRNRIRKAYEDLYYQVGVKSKAWTDQDVKKRFTGKKEEDRRPMQIPNFKPPKPESVTPRMGLGFFNPAWLARLKQIVTGLDVAGRINSVTDTVKKQVKKSLEESLQQFVSPRKIAAKLRKDVGGMFSKQRAEMIARTEVTHVTNIAAEQSANETGLNLVKGWIHTMDSKTRDSHRNVSSKLIPNNEKFLVGGKRMKFPGDPAGGLKEIVRCRCVVYYLPSDDTEGFE